MRRSRANGEEARDGDSCRSFVYCGVDLRRLGGLVAELHRHRGATLTQPLRGMLGHLAVRADVPGVDVETGRCIDLRPAG